MRLTNRSIDGLHKFGAFPILKAIRCKLVRGPTFLNLAYLAYCFKLLSYAIKLYIINECLINCKGANGSDILYIIPNSYLYPN